jgi:hypothetical protein
VLLAVYVHFFPQLAGQTVAGGAGLLLSTNEKSRKETSTGLLSRDRRIAAVYMHFFPQLAGQTVAGGGQCAVWWSSDRMQSVGW